jgi:hypothetical protein
VPLPILLVTSFDGPEGDSVTLPWIPEAPGNGTYDPWDRSTGGGGHTDTVRSVDGKLPDSIGNISLASSYASVLVYASSPDLIVNGAITRSSTGAATSFSVSWPDGAVGTYSGTESTSFPGVIDSYSVTHVLGGTTTTYTQPAVTRDSTGAVTNVPTIVVS